MNTSTSFNSEGYKDVIGADIVLVLLKLSSVSLVGGCTGFEVCVVVANFVLCRNPCDDHIQHVLHTCMHQLDVCSALRIVLGLMLRVTNLQNV